MSNGTPTLPEAVVKAVDEFNRFNREFHIRPQPSRPTIKTAKFVATKKKVELIWTSDQQYQDGITIERRDPGDRDFKPLATVGPGVENFDDDSGFVAGETYAYRVRAFNKRADSVSDSTDVRLVQP